MQPQFGENCADCETENRKFWFPILIALIILYITLRNL